MHNKFEEDTWIFFQVIAPTRSNYWRKRRKIAISRPFWIFFQPLLKMSDNWSLVTCITNLGRIHFKLSLTPTPPLTPTTLNFNCNSQPFLIKIKRRANKDTFLLFAGMRNHDNTLPANTRYWSNVASTLAQRQTVGQRWNNIGLIYRGCCAHYYIRHHICKAAIGLPLLHGATPQTRDVDPMLVRSWAKVADGGPTLSRHWVNASCFLRHTIQFYVNRAHEIGTRGFYMIVFYVRQFMVGLELYKPTIFLAHLGPDLRRHVVNRKPIYKIKTWIDLPLYCEVSYFKYKNLPKSLYPLVYNYIINISMQLINPYSAEIDFSQILTSKVDPRTVGVKNISNGRRPIGIQMNQKELTRPFVVISNWNNPLVSMVYTKIF